MAWATGASLGVAGSQRSAAVAFSGSATGGAAPYAYEWNFGDGDSSTDQNPEHVYSPTGAYLAVLTVTDRGGNASTSTVDAPVPVFGISSDVGVGATPRIGPVPLRVAFVFSDSLFREGWRFSWQFGEGNGSAASAPNHTYAHPGTFTVRLDLTDPYGSPEPYAITIIAGGPTPTILADVDPEVTGRCEPFSQDVHFETAIAGGAPPYAFAWEFGDGATGTGPDPTHTYSAHREALAVNVTATDANGTAATTSLSYYLTSPPGCNTLSVGFPFLAPILALTVGSLAAVGAAVLVRRWRDRKTLGPKAPSR